MLLRGETPGLWRFVAAVFLGATRVFIAEPLTGKSVLPLLGGTRAVWNGCLLFFQLALLAGYWYAGWAPASLGLRRHAVFHLVLLAGGIRLLPFGVQCALAQDPRWRSLNAGPSARPWTYDYSNRVGALRWVGR